MTIFNEDDIRLLNKTLQIREQIIDNILKTSLPKTAREIDSFTNLLESVDRSILNKAKIKIEDANARANEETKEILRDLLMELHKNSNSSNLNTSNSSREIPEYKPRNMNILEGELIRKIDIIDVNSILKDTYS